MNLFNKKLLQQKIEGFKGFPEGVQLENTKKIITGWVKSLKDSDLSKTKEKSVEKSFLIRIFSDVLGYIDMGTSDDTFNLYPDYTIDGLYADGALGFFSKDKKQPLAVIELKDALTSLDKKQTGREKGYTPVEQAYQYSTKLDGCNWIIVSNFREIRIYNKSKSPDYYEKIDVLDLENDKEFKRFFYIFSKANLLTDGNQSSITDNLLSQSTAQDEDITKAFYKEYKEIRLNFYNHLLEFNSEIEKIVLLEKAQKTLDRLIFVLFCEDTNGLLPLNISKLTYELGKKSRDRSDEKIWREYKNLFMDIDEGRFDIDPPINKYNGGLFKHDEILDNLHIKDSIWDELLRLSKYDFDSDINVNILGHIFEQSISDLESIKAEISGEVQEKSKSKRKKDGIFYTPEYITKYIVENSVGKYLEEHPEKLETIKILDPACGSGSMLNQAHSFLLQEYRNRFEQMIAEKESKKELRTLFDYNPAEVNRGILLNNLFGVDLNQESVEITKLSLWLKTASKVEPLQNLDKNIKCGNSLIDDPEIAGEKAFDWNKEYKEIMDEGGFDVIIGNPPWGAEISDKDREFYLRFFESCEYQLDTYVLFIEKALNLLSDNGYLCFITPSTWLNQHYFSKIREILLNKYKLELVKVFRYQVFENVTADTCIFLCKKTPAKDNDFIKISHLENYSVIESEDRIVTTVNWRRSISNGFNVYFDDSLLSLVNKIFSESVKLKDISKIVVGIKPYQTGKGIPKQTKEDVLQRSFDSDVKKDDSYREYIVGKDINRYTIKPLTHKYIKYGKWLAEPRESINYSLTRIIVRQTADSIISALDVNGYLNLNNLHNITLNNDIDPHYLLGILNSRLINFVYQFLVPEMGRVFAEVKIVNLEKLPIVISSELQTVSLKKLVIRLMELKQSYIELHDSAISLIKSNYNVTKDFKFEIGFNELLDFFVKNKIKLTLQQKEELQSWYKKKQSEITDIKFDIKQIEDRVNFEVYKIYGLNDDEIKLIEKNNV